jgi:type VI secretion system secreted protein VgrG
MSHTLIVHSALGDQLPFRSITGTESMGARFKFQAHLFSKAKDISAKSLPGTELTIEVDPATEAGGGGKRYLLTHCMSCCFQPRAEAIHTE